MRYHSDTPLQTAEVARDFLNRLFTLSHTEAVTLGLYGDLGAGKTNFTQAIAQALGVVEVVSSPTYVIQKIYKLNNQPFDHLIHIDAYRLLKSAELSALGWAEIIANPKNLVLVEWPERVLEVMPQGHIKITFAHGEKDTRIIETSI
ncbi:MAG: tRNA (adenosine(37)-N6)-threonylcarbamoyltransferase complex ATPase subunit type 1 TsaE [Patescibacteria group bacterium]